MATISKSNGVELIKIDEIDRKILTALQKDGKMSFRDLAHETGYSVSTIKKHVDRLDAQKIIKIRGVVDCHKIGYTEMLILFIRVNSTVKIDQILANLHEIEKINAIYQVTGTYPLFCMAKCIGKEDEMQVMEKVKSIPGVEEIITNIVLNCVKDEICLEIPQIKSINPQIS